MSPRRGIWLTLFVNVSCIIPPSTTVSPLFTTTLVFADRFVVVGPTWLAFSRESAATADDSWKMSRLTKSLSRMWGVSRSVMPTSFRSTVLMVLARFVESLAWLVMNGTFEPTTISASLLSRVSRCGEERMLMLFRDWAARSTAVTAGIFVPSGRVTLPAIPPAISPVPEKTSGLPVASAANSWLMFPWKSKLDPVITAPLPPVCTAPRNSAPRSRDLSRVISMMTAST